MLRRTEQKLFSLERWFSFLGMSYKMQWTSDMHKVIRIWPYITVHIPSTVWISVNANTSHIERNIISDFFLAKNGENFTQRINMVNNKTFYAAHHYFMLTQCLVVCRVKSCLQLLSFFAEWYTQWFARSYSVIAVYSNISSRVYLSIRFIFPIQYIFECYNCIITIIINICL